MSGVDAGHRPVGVDAARQIVHDVEDRSDHIGVVAEKVDFRRWHISFGERLKDAVFPVDGVRRRQQFPRRLFAQHIGPARRLEMKGRIRLAAVELSHDAALGDAWQAPRQIAYERRLVEAMICQDLDERRGCLGRHLNHERAPANIWRAPGVRAGDGALRRDRPRCAACARICTCRKAQNRQ